MQDNAFLDCAWCDVHALRGLTGYEINRNHVVVVVLTLSRIIKSVVTGQAPVTLGLRNTPEKTHTTQCGIRIYHGVVTKTTDRDSLRYAYNGTRRVRQLALGCESN